MSRRPDSIGRGDHPPQARLSEHGSGKLASAVERWPDIPMRVCRAFENEAYESVLGRYEHAVPTPRDTGHRRQFQAQMELLLHQLAKPMAGVEPDAEGLALLIAVSLVALALEPLGPVVKPQGCVRLPDDWDEDSFLDTVALRSVNFLGRRNLFQENLSSALYAVLTGEPLLEKLSEREKSLGAPQLHAADDLQDAAQQAITRAFVASGGPTPELIRHIVDHGDIPDGTLLHSVKDKRVVGETVAAIRRCYELMKQRYGSGLDLDGFALWLRGQAGDSQDMIQGLTGKLVRAVSQITPDLWPPERTTALRYTSASRRGDWISETWKYFRALYERAKKRRQRRQKRLGPELDAPVELRDGPATAHESVGDPNASMPERELLRSDDGPRSPTQGARPGTRKDSPTRPELDPTEEEVKALEELFGTLTRRQAQVAKLLGDGYHPKGVAEWLRLSPSRVSRIVAVLRRKCRRQFPD